MARRTKRGMNRGQFGWSPKFLKEEVYVATFALVVCLFAGAGLLDRYIKESGSSYIAAVIAAVLVDLANDDREAVNLEGLTVNSKLAAAAQAKADDMAAKGYFAHVTPEGHDSWHWFNLVEYDYAYAGENLAVNFSESADVEKAWMQSPTHRDNILNVHYTEIGIATAKGTYKGREATFAVQMFGRPSAAEIAEEDEISVEPVAATQDSTQVLGETDIEEVSPVGAIAEQDLPAQAGGDAIVIAPEDIPWWGRIAAQPKETLRYAYYIIGLLILAGLFFDMEIELKWHHFRHARKAGFLLATMSMLFIAADWLFFAEPILASVGQLLN